MFSNLWSPIRKKESTLTHSLTTTANAPLLMNPLMALWRFKEIRYWTKMLIKVNLIRVTLVAILTCWLLVFIFLALLNSAHSLVLAWVTMVSTYQPIWGEYLSTLKHIVTMAHYHPGHGNEPDIVFHGWRNQIQCDERPYSMDTVQGTLFAWIRTVEELDGVGVERESLEHLDGLLWEDVVQV